jgi:hypothetical protein
MSFQDAKLILDNRKAKGFTVILVMLLGVGASGNVDGNADGRSANTEGERPWLNDDPVTPNEKYFRNVDAVLDYANSIGITIVLGIYHSRMGSRNPLQMHNARAWARWLATRYRRAPNLIWGMFPRPELECLPMARELARGLKEGDKGCHLISAHPDPSPASSGTVLHRERWLAFNTIQTFKWVERIVPMVSEDRNRFPRKPVIMAEGAYEDGIEYGFTASPAWIRRQAWYSCLAGGWHCYGHNDSWRIWPTWKKALDAPGASQMSIVKHVITDRFEWWKLHPDPSIIVEGRSLVGDMLTLAARHPRWKWLMAYRAGPGECAVRLDRMPAGRGRRAFCIDPRTGVANDVALSAGGASTSFSTPPGWEDALLVIEST